jgi:hypothetical protein
LHPFGGANKLTAEGPFLALLSKFDEHLNQQRNLVVIGYSFRDPHINHCIVRWLERDPARSMTIIGRKGAAIVGLPADLMKLERRFHFDPCGAEEGIAKHFGRKPITA